MGLWAHYVAPRLNMKRTPLFSAHQQLGGKLIEFGGWEMPVQYSSISEEHLAVRKAAGIFDISHMGEVYVRGAAAEKFLNRTLTNDVGKLALGQGQYTIMCNAEGGAIDDLYAYRLDRTEYLLIVNASRIEADVAWLRKQSGEFDSGGALSLEDASDRTGAVAVQGPRVVDFIDKIFPGPSENGTLVGHPTELAKNQVGNFVFERESVWVSRTGYTGEDGFEIVASEDRIEAVWRRVLEAGKPAGLKPAGLGARDTLRTEACYPLYGHELDENTTPIEAGLGFFVGLEKGDFVGRQVLAAQKQHGVKKRLAAFRMSGRSAPPRPGYPVWSSGSEGRVIGSVTSGTQSPSLNAGIGLGFIPPEFAKAKTTVEIEIRGKRAEAMVVPKPFYRKAD